MNNEDLQALRTPLAVLVAVMALATGAVYYTDMLAKKAAVALTQQKGVFQTAQSRMRQSGDEKNTIVQYVDKYRELEKTGFAGEEQRINWLDALRNANNRAELFGVNYQIGVQKPYPYASEFAPGSISLQESIMELDMRLLHEGDLPRFFDELRAQQVGLFHVKECTLLRTDRTETLRNQPYLNAKCDLAWITARPSAAGPGTKR
jgi:hypothetical protein